MAEQETSGITGVQMAQQLITLYFQTKGQPVPPELTLDLQNLVPMVGAPSPAAVGDGLDWPDFTPGERKQGLIRARQRIAQKRLTSAPTVPTPGTSGGNAPGAGATAPGLPVTLSPMQRKQARIKALKERKPYGNQ